MVYIYGGAFLMGEASRELYAPDYIMSEEVILVTINYRLCALGIYFHYFLRQKFNMNFCRIS